MASYLFRHGGEERRDFHADAAAALPVVSSGVRFRRGRRLVRAVPRRCRSGSASVLLLVSLLFLGYLSFYGRRLPAHASNESLASHTHYLSCQIDFLESVDHIIEPTDYMNVSQFSLEYIDDENSHERDIYKPRFGGHQTLKERENSFYARNETLHCGFIKGPKGFPTAGFDLNKKDQDYMHSCKVVVSSCIFGSSDYLRRPTRSKISALSKDQVCFVMFLDELTMSQLASEGTAPDERGNIGLWRIIIVRNLPYTDVRKAGKVPKFLSHRLFPSASYSIWIDSKMRLNADPLLILEYFLWRKRSEYAISIHYDRRCVWEEVLQNKRLNKYNHTAIDEQFMFYQSDGLVRFDDSDKNTPFRAVNVPEGSFIARAHTPMSNLFSCLWFNEVDRFTSRDQLSFGYTFLKFRRMNPEREFRLSMFQDCERRRVAKLFHHRGESPPVPRIL
ncbi:unnamed protein product [Spirodela intermedia]|uniref:TOD1/MUCI70 glycosyltransferase-like domain-containing protein n=1 Tax=Spirodela intermedia TaxID=51605 RepID=A0A7I8J2R6_SPIIN|nr:unnamed protein product [Spirodela intermedia]CAA6664505.1 unnamed protein product [Spirodela intermedia]